jgi:hypothetical protein
MQWDLGLQGLAVLAAMSLGFGVFEGLVVGNGWSYRSWAAAITTVACFGLGLLTSEVWFGWATEEDLQPNIDGLSRDEALLAGVLTTLVVVLVMRHRARRARHPHVGHHVTSQLLGRRPGRHRHA